eukprot:6208419-Pleurochrysis_carterae.AAC.6
MYDRIQQARHSDGSAKHAQLTEVEGRDHQTRNGLAGRKTSKNKANTKVAGDLAQMLPSSRSD